MSESPVPDLPLLPSSAEKNIIRRVLKHSAPNPQRGTIQIVLWYAIISLLWIISSDRVAALIAPDPVILLTINTLKGWGFVVLTSLLLYWMIRRYTHEIINSRTQLANIIESAMDAIISIDKAERIFQFNAAAEQMFQLRAAEAIGQPIGRLISERFHDEHQNHVRQFVWADEAHGTMDRLKRLIGVRANGQEFPIEATISQVEASSEKSLILILRDITERQRTEAALRESEDRYRDLVQNSQDLICTFDLSGRLLLVNPITARSLGYELSEMLGHTIRGFLAADYQRGFDGYLSRLRRRGAISGLVEVCTKSGEKRIWEFNTTLRTAGTVEPIVRGMAHDITERRRAEEAGRDQRRLAEALLDTAAALNSTLEFDEVLDRILENVEKVVPLDTVTVMLRDGDVFQVVRYHGLGQYVGSSTDLPGVFPLAKFANLQAIVSTAQPQMIEDTRTYPGWVPLAGYEWVNSFLSAPIVIDSAVVGLINLNAARPKFYKPSHLARLQAFADQVAIALKNAQHLRTTREQRALAEALRDTALALNSTLQFDEVLDRVLVNVERVVPLDTIDVMLREGEVCHVVRARGYEEHTASGQPPRDFSIKDFGYIRQVIETGRSVILDDVQLDPAWKPLPGYEWIHSHLAVPILIDNQVVGLINLESSRSGFYTPEHAAHLQAFAGQVAVAMKNAELLIEAKERSNELKLFQAQLRAVSARAESAREEERISIAREVHDDLGQSLTGLKMDLTWLTKQLSAKNQLADLPAKLQDMSDLIDHLIQSVRRIATELRPGVLDDLGLIAALEWQAGDFRQRTSIGCAFYSSVAELSMEPHRATAVFRIFQETLTNVARHSQASQVKVFINVVKAHLWLEVFDNGTGISEEALINPKSLGMAGIRERALLVGGQVYISSEAGGGTLLRLAVPLVEA